MLQQLAHLYSYPVVAERVEDGKLGLHAWWFDIADADVLAYDGEAGQFVPLTHVVEPREAASALRRLLPAG